jgi:hypothetical protein
VSVEAPMRIPGSLTGKVGPVGVLCRVARLALSMHVNGARWGRNKKRTTSQGPAKDVTANNSVSTENKGVERHTSKHALRRV